MTEELKEWLRLYLKHKALFTGGSLELDEDCFLTLVKKDSKERYAVLPTLEPGFWNRDAEVFVCYNTPENLELVLKEWDSLKKQPSVKIMFVNPSLSNKWVLSPYTHSLIADPSTLASGLKALQEQALSEQ